MAQAVKAKKSSVKIDKTYYEGVGRRRTSVARVRVYHAKKAGVTIDDVSYKPGAYIVNNQEITKWGYRDWETDRKSTRLNSSHLKLSRMPSSA